MSPSILTINSGSSSLKADYFLPDGTRQKFRYEHIGHGFPHDHAEAFNALVRDLGDDRPQVVGHRFVHGGEIKDAARLLNVAELARLQSLTHLAPLHMPGNLLGVEVCKSHFDVPQIACFDTAFHATLPEISWRLPIPARFGLRRFGFHGLNYAHIARQLPDILGEKAMGRVIVAHLGSGASLCVMHELKSVDTTMGYTPAGGIPMGTRSGDVDPGVMLEQEHRMDSEALSHLVYKEMGLLALSGGEDSEMSVLLESTNPQAAFAVAYFARQVRSAIGAMAAKSGGVDALVFTGGIGEHAASVRAMICHELAFMKVWLDPTANAKNALFINDENAIPVLIIAADEEKMIRDLCEAKFTE